MAKQSGLVVEHLENIAASVLADHQEIIRKYIRGRQGVYALYHNEHLYYVGLASNLRGRVKHHLRDRHKGSWNRFSLYLLRETTHMRELEALMLRIVKPKGNRQIGRLNKSKNLQRELTHDMREQQRQQLADIFGTARRVKRLPTRRTLTTNDLGELAPYLSRRMALRGTYKGEKYRATVRKNGWINFNGYLYRSPSLAARAALKRKRNGWDFWHYRDRYGEWVKLRTLRR